MDLAATTAQFQKDGYAVIPDFLDESDVAALRQEIWNIIDNMDPAKHHTIFSTREQVTMNGLHASLTNDDYFMTSGDKIRFFFEKGALDEKGNLLVEKQLSVNKIGHALHALNPVFKRITFSEKMKNVVRYLRMVDPVLCQSMYIFKQPGMGGEVLPHQDSTFLNTTPMKLVGFWIALEDATLENGCLWFIPGSHKDGLAGGRRMIRNPDMCPGKPGTIFNTQPVFFDEEKFIPAEVKKGSLVLIHGEVVHKSELNLSSKSRHAYTFHTYDQDGTEYSSQNWLQPTDAKTFAHFYTFA